MTKPKIWMYGMTCLKCGNGYYPGYSLKEKTTMPCTECGDIQPHNMTQKEIREKIKERDEKLYGTKETKPN